MHYLCFNVFSFFFFINVNFSRRQIKHYINCETVDMQTPQETSHSIWVYCIPKCRSELCENLAFGV